jgi:hypothetical protein
MKEHVFEIFIYILVVNSLSRDEYIHHNTDPKYTKC